MKKDFQKWHKKARFNGLFGVDPTGLAPASLRVDGKILLYKLQARIHGFNCKTKETSFKVPIVDTQV